MIVPERWIRILATVLGILALGLPLFHIWLRRDTQRGRSAGKHLFLTKWPVISGLTIAFVSVGIVLWKPIPLAYPPILQLIITLAGSVLYFPGILLYLWGFKSLGSMFGVSSSMAAQLYEGHRLVRNGPYSIVRHPMYLGVILTAIGALLIFRTWAMIVFAPGAFGIIARARREEKLLAAEFGNAWNEYATQVPAWIPRLKKRNGSAGLEIDQPE